MKCPWCRSDNPDSARFCANCAEPLHPSNPIQGIPTKTIATPASAIPKATLVGGRYRVVDEIGRGGMGVVYRAEDTRLKRTVALKFLSPELTADPETRERFIQEAQAASALDHPNICTIHEIDETEDGRMFIAMACYEGQSLRERLKRGRLTREEALATAVQVARGLVQAQEKGIIHRDIKPANIFIATHGTVKILDFGLAKLTADIRLTRTGTTLGTVAYMSPEQAEGKAVDGRTDVWSLGVTLYEMLTGGLPFGGEHEGSLLYSIVHKPPRPPRKADPGIAPEIERVILKALEKNPSDRYQTMTEFLSDLEALADGLKPSGAKPGLLRGRILGIRKPVLYAVTVAVLVLVGLGLRQLLVVPGRMEVLDSVAVLPLVNYSGDREQEYFADSLTDMLTADLYKISALRVIPPQSVRKYTKSDKSVREIAGELNVKAIVQASVFRSENRVRLIARLIDPIHDRQIWAETFERELSDVFFLQSDLSQAIVSGIRVVLAPEERERLTSAHKVNPEAFDLYLRGYNAVWLPETLNSVEKQYREAIDYHNRAIKIDPNFALAYTHLGNCYLTLGLGGYMPEEEAYLKGKEAIRKALELDETFADAHINLGLIKWLIDWDFPGANKEYIRALELEPGNIFVLGGYNQLLAGMGRFEEVIERQKRLEESMPQAVFERLAWFYICAGRYDEGLEEAKKAAKKNPSNWNIGCLAIAYEMRKMYAEALAEMNKIMALPDSQNDKEAIVEMARILALSGRREEALETMMKLQSQGAQENIDTSVWMAAIYTALGENDKAFGLLNEGYNKRSTRMPATRFIHWFHGLHGDPRFDDLVKKIGFPEVSAPNSQRK